MGKSNALYAAPLPLGGLVPLALLNDVLRARRLSVLLAQQPARHALPQTSALGRVLLRYRSDGLGHSLQRCQVDQRCPLVPIVAVNARPILSALRSRGASWGRCSRRGGGGAPAHHVVPAALKVRFDAAGWDVLRLGPLFVLVRGRFVPVHDAFDQEVRLAQPTLIEIIHHGDQNKPETVRTSSLYSMIARSISPSPTPGPPLHVTMVLSCTVA